MISGYLRLRGLNDLRKLFDRLAAARNLEPKSADYEDLASKMADLYLAGITDPDEIARRIDGQPAA